MKQNEKNTCYTIYSQKLMAILVLKGFVLVDMRPDKKGNGKNVFFFKDSPKIREVVEEYTVHNK